MGNDHDHDLDYDDDHCGNCGDEGFIYGCSWDWQCETYDEGEGTCLCARRCDWCNPLSPAEIAEREQLRAVISTALAKDKIAGIRAAQAMEAGTAETGTGSVHDSAVHAPEQ